MALAPLVPVCCAAVAVALPLLPVAAAVVDVPVVVALTLVLPLFTAAPIVAHAPKFTDAGVKVWLLALNADSQALFVSWRTTRRSVEVQSLVHRQGIARSWILDWPVVHWQ